MRGVKYLGASLVRVSCPLVFRPGSSYQNLILLESYLGTRLDCNPMAMYVYLREKYPGRYSYVWAAEKPEFWGDLKKNSDTTIVAYRSLEHWRCACLANVLITNSPRSNELPSRKSQLQIQTWHGGGCYKRVGTALHKGMPIARVITRNQFSRFDYFLSSSQFFSDEVIRGQYGFAGKILEYGMPRNDRLVCSDEPARRLMRERLGVGDEEYLVLYAPTWRDFSGEPESLHVSAVREAFERRFRKTVITGVRGHYFSGFSSDEFDRNFNDERDMQGLLLACDAVITDYSSLIWDFSFTYRPCFLFTPDLAQYERDRGFDVDIHEWGFPVCETTESLVQAIESFDPSDFRKRMERHHELLGSFESGHAREAVARVIEEHCFGKKENR